MMKSYDHKVVKSQRWLNEASRQIELHQSVIGLLGRALFECEDERLTRFFRSGIDVHLFAQDDLIHTFNTPQMTKKAWISGMSQSMDLGFNDDNPLTATIQMLFSAVQRIQRRLMIGLSDMNLSEEQIRIYRHHYITLSTFYSYDKIVKLL